MEPKTSPGLGQGHRSFAVPPLSCLARFPLVFSTVVLYILTLQWLKLLLDSCFLLVRMVEAFSTADSLTRQGCDEAAAVTPQAYSPCPVSVELCGSHVSGAIGLWRLSGRNSCL